MGHQDPHSFREAEYICYIGPRIDQRTGEFLFNNLRFEIAEAIRNTELDPFYQEMDFEDVVDWLDDHIVFDNQGTMIRVFDDHGILWEAA